MFAAYNAGVLIRGLIVWLVIICAETVHGILRTMLLEPVMGGFEARQFSVFTGSLMILGITFASVRWIKGDRAVYFILIGAMWIVLTVGFEVLLGRALLDLSWDRILSDYDLSRGGLMAIGLLVMFFAPLGTAKLLDEL
jgi:hypothetical protein